MTHSAVKMVAQKVMMDRFFGGEILVDPYWPAVRFRFCKFVHLTYRAWWYRRSYIPMSIWHLDARPVCPSVRNPSRLACSTSSHHSCCFSNFFSLSILASTILSTYFPSAAKSLLISSFIISPCFLP